MSASTFPGTHLSTAWCNKVNPLSSARSVMLMDELLRARTASVSLSRASSSGRKIDQSKVICVYPDWEEFSIRLVVVLFVTLKLNYNLNLQATSLILVFVSLTVRIKLGLVSFLFFCFNDVLFLRS